MLSVWQHERLLELSPMAFGWHLTKINVTQCNVMSIWSLRWHLTNKSITGAPYSIKHYSLSHSWTLWWRVQWLKHAVPSWGRGGTAAAMTAQNEHWKEHQYNSNSCVWLRETTCGELYEVRCKPRPFELVVVQHFHYLCHVLICLHTTQQLNMNQKCLLFCWLGVRKSIRPASIEWRGAKR